MKVKVEFTVRTSMRGSIVKETIEFEEPITDEEIEAYYREWVSEQIDGNWHREE